MALGRDAEIGSLATGKAADLIVLDRHLDDASSSSEVLATKVRYTFMGGTMLVGAARPWCYRCRVAVRPKVRGRKVY